MTKSPAAFAPPLIYQMAARVATLPKRGIEEEHKSILNKLRRYRATSIVEMALHMLWNPPAGRLEALQTMPWLTLLLLKWALQDNGVCLRVGPPISEQDLDRLRQQLWNLHGTGVDRQDGTNVWLMLRTILHVQFEFQRSETWGFLRWPALYGRLDPDSVNRRQFREVIGMEPHAFMDLAYALYAAVLECKMPLESDWLNPFRTKYGKNVDRMYELFVRDLPSLRTELQRDAAQKIRGKQELYEFPYLRRFPFLRLRDGRLHCWHPLVFARGLEDAVHLRLSGLGKNYVDPFSRVFEQYVIELVTESGLPSLNEAEYKSQAGHEAPAVEAIIEGDACNIFVEAKMSLFADDVLLQDSEKAIYQKTKRLRDAIKQGWKVSALIRDPINGFGQRFNADQDFLLIVTSRELLIGSGEALKRLYAAETLNYPDNDAEQHLPLSNVFVVSIDDFEATMGCVATGKIDLSVLLKDAVQANQDGLTARMLFSDFIGKYTDHRPLSTLINDAKRGAEERVFATLGGTTHDE